MMKWINQNVATLGATALIVLAASALGCPPPPQQVQQPVYQPAPQPVGPTTDEWVDVPTVIYYERGSSRLGDPERAMLAEAQASMSARTDIVRISIDGHADDGGSAARNELLANERAQGVLDYLTGSLRMPRELFEVHGHGNTQPLTSGTTQADEATNRRVQFRMLVRRQASY